MTFSFAHRPVLFIGSVLLGVGLLTTHPTLTRSIRAGLGNLPLFLGEAELERTKKAQELQGNSEMLRRIAIKESIIEELLADRITLGEATDQFTEINATNPECMARILAGYPGQTEREKMARNVLSFALVQTSHAQRSAVMCRLEKDLELMLSESTGE